MDFRCLESVPPRRIRAGVWTTRKSSFFVIFLLMLSTIVTNPSNQPRSAPQRPTFLRVRRVVLRA